MAVASFTIRSTDGTELGAMRTGAGTSVVLVHGTMGTKDDWSEVSRRLGTDCEVTSFDRRGRGASGDGPGYSLDREVDDILAVVDTCDSRVSLIGHSFGAVLSVLAVARAADRFDRLVLYEPPVGDLRSPDDPLEDRLDIAIAAGNQDGAVEAFLEGVGATTEEIRANRSRPNVWAALRRAVGTASREIRAAKAVLPFDPDVVAAVRVPTLVLMGAEQANESYSGLRDLAEQLPMGRLEYVPGHHLALVFASDAFVAVIRSFFTTT